MAVPLNAHASIVHEEILHTDQNIVSRLLPVDISLYMKIFFVSIDHDTSTGICTSIQVHMVLHNKGTDSAIQCK